MTRVPISLLDRTLHEVNNFGIPVGIGGRCEGNYFRNGCLLWPPLWLMFALQFCVAWKITNDRYWEVIKATFCRSRVLFYLGRSSRKCHAPQFCLLGSGIAFILPTSTIIRSENILGFYTSPWSWTLGVSPLRSTNLFLTRGKVYIQGGGRFRWPMDGYCNYSWTTFINLDWLDPSELWPETCLYSRKYPCPFIGTNFLLFLKHFTRTRIKGIMYILICIGKIWEPQGRFVGTYISKMQIRIISV